MINADVVVENKLWNKKIKNPSNYIKKKIKKISKADIKDGGEGAICIFLKNNKNL